MTRKKVFLNNQDENYRVSREISDQRKRSLKSKCKDIFKRKIIK